MIIIVYGAVCGYLVDSTQFQHIWLYLGTSNTRGSDQAILSRAAGSEGVKKEWEGFDLALVSWLSPRSSRPYQAHAEQSRLFNLKAGSSILRRMPRCPDEESRKVVTKKASGTTRPALEGAGQNSGYIRIRSSEDLEKEESLGRREVYGKCAWGNIISDEPRLRR